MNDEQIEVAVTEISQTLQKVFKEANVEPNGVLITECLIFTLASLVTEGIVHPAVQCHMLAAYVRKVAAAYRPKEDNTSSD